MSPDGLTYDTGALIAAERSGPLMWSLHRAALSRGLVPTVPAGVLAEAWRGGPQHNMARLLKGCQIEALVEDQARRLGALAAACGLSDTVDLSVAEGAVGRNDAVVTSNRTHIEQAASGLGRRLTIHEV
ncbi:MAG: twitching motility protein PilT [Sporichthyaceae bacterium]